MRVNKRLLLVAVILGLITVIALNLYLKSMASEDQAMSAVAYKEVVTAKNTIPEYTRITAEMLSMQSLPADSVHPEALTDINDAVGGITSSEIIKDEQLLASRVVMEQSSAGLAYRIPEKLRAISIPVNEVTGVSGYIAPGNRVDVLVTYSDEEINELTTTYTIVQNALVMATGEHTRENEEEERQVSTTVTLAVTPGQAEVLAYALIKGTFHLTLRSPLDEEKVPLDHYNAGNLETFRER